MHAGNTAGGEQFEAGFAHKFFHERIADLDRAALLLGGFLGQIFGGERRAREAVASRGRADVENGVAHALGRAAARVLFMPEHAETEGIHQRIAFVGLVEINFARNGRDAEAVAIMRDAADDAGEQATYIPGWKSVAETQGIDRADWPRTHGKNIAHDAADAGGRSLKRLNSARRVM